MVRARLDVHCCRSWHGVASSRHLLDGQHISSSWQHGAIGVPLCDGPCRPAIDLKIETDIPPEVRYSSHRKAARRVVMIRPEVPGTSLRNSADENCAPKNQNRKKTPCQDVF